MGNANRSLIINGIDFDKRIEEAKADIHYWMQSRRMEIEREDYRRRQMQILFGYGFIIITPPQA